MPRKCRFPIRTLRLPSRALEDAHLNRRFAPTPGLGRAGSETPGLRAAGCGLWAAGRAVASGFAGRAAAPLAGRGIRRGATPVGFLGHLTKRPQAVTTSTGMGRWARPGDHPAFRQSCRRVPALFLPESRLSWEQDSSALASWSGRAHP